MKNVKRNKNDRKFIFEGYIIKNNSNSSRKDMIEIKIMLIMKILE